MTAIPAQRSKERLRAHFDIESELANRLKTADKSARQRLYAELYDELYSRVPDHPMLAHKSSPQDRQVQVDGEMRLLSRFLNPECVLLEIGAGDCRLSFAAAQQVRQVYGLEVSAEIAKCDHAPRNFSLILSDGTSIDLPDSSVDVAYSNQLLEHLHSDDAAEQTRNVWRVLKPGGKYVCVTPNRISGPHDISRYFSNHACGFHLKEYSNVDLSSLFRSVGFRKVTAWAGAKGKFAPVPLFTVAAYEAILSLMPRRLRQMLGKLAPSRALLGIRMVAEK